MNLHRTLLKQSTEMVYNDVYRDKTDENTKESKECDGKDVQN